MPTCPQINLKQLSTRTEGNTIENCNKKFMTAAQVRLWASNVPIIYHYIILYIPIWFN